MNKGDMTSGKIGRQLIFFAVPLLLGNLLQQLYNAVDAAVVGNFVGPEALATVGVTGTLAGMVVFLVTGLCSSANVLTARFFGAKDESGVHKTVHTAMLLALVIGAALSGVGILAASALLRAMNTPESLLAGAESYLRIYFAGIVPLTVYNMGAAVLTAMGDSRRPLFFLLVSTALNTVGDLLFVAVFGWGVAGAAAATVIAEVIASAFVVVTLCRAKGPHRLHLRRLRIDPETARGIARLGVPAALQQAIITASNVVVQAYINGLGAVAVAGYAAAAKLDAFLPLPIQTMALAVTTFVSQNLGAGNVARARRGTRWSMLIGIGATVTLSSFALVFHDTFLGVFSSDPETLRYGFEFLCAFAPFYFILSGTQIIPGALRGAGDIRTATFASIGCFVAVRQIYLAIVTKFAYTPTAVGLSYPITWLICAAIICAHYLRSDWGRFEKPMD
jgi:putative MATE family efflux protein